jgi:hypothetical protein
MIDPTKEKIYSLAQLARWLDAIGDRKPPHPGTLARWATRGIRGVRLETLRAGGRICSTKEAVARFFNELSSDRSVSCKQTQSGPPARDSSRILDELGF